MATLLSAVEQEQPQGKIAADEETSRLTQNAKAAFWFAVRCNDGKEQDPSRLGLD